MRIGINALYWIPNRMGGTQTYFLELMRGLLRVERTHTYVVLLNAEGAKSFPIRDARITVVVSPASGRNRFARMLWENFGMNRVLRVQHVDLLHSLGYLSPLRVSVPTVATILDMIHYLFPEGIERSKLLLWKRLLPLTVRSADALVAISRSGRRDIIAFFPSISQKVISIPLAVDHARFTPGTVWLPGAPASGESIVLAVASVATHKNIGVLLQAFAMLCGRFPLARLRLVGQSGTATASLTQQILELGLSSRVEFTGRVSDDALVECYRTAVVLVVPSLYEGFGLPVLEAMASGCPVIASNVSSLPEVAGDAALLFDPHDANALSQHLADVLGSTELQEQLRARGLRNAAQFTWDHTAAATLDVYESVLDGTVQLRADFDSFSETVGGVRVT